MPQKVKNDAYTGPSRQLNDIGFEKWRKGDGYDGNDEREKTTYDMLCVPTSYISNAY